MTSSDPSLLDDHKILSLTLVCIPRGCLDTPHLGKNAVICTLLWNPQHGHGRPFLAASCSLDYLLQHSDVKLYYCNWQRDLWSSFFAGRAGNKGTAYTFICEDEEKYAPDLVKALSESNAAIPQDLQDMADSFAVRHKRGEAEAHGTGYGGRGFKFDATEDETRNAERKVSCWRYLECCFRGDSSSSSFTLPVIPPPYATRPWSATKQELSKLSLSWRVSDEKLSSVSACQ